MFNLNMKKKILKLFDSAQSLKTPQKYTTTNQINTRYVREEIKGGARPSCTCVDKHSKLSWFVYAKTDQICCQRIKKAINMRFLHVEGKLSNQN